MSTPSVSSLGIRDFTAEQLVRIARLFASDDSHAGQVDLSVTERQRIPLDSNAHLEVWLMVWPVGSSTGWHDHGQAAGAYVVVTGELIEESRRGGAASDLLLEKGDDRAFGAGHIHNMTNVGDTPALTVHAYSPGLTEMTPYELVDGRLVPINP